MVSSLTVQVFVVGEPVVHILIIAVFVVIG